MLHQANIYKARYNLPNVGRVFKVLQHARLGRDPMKLVFEWTKTNVIGLKEFKGLMNMILMEEIEAEQARVIDEFENSESF